MPPVSAAGRAEDAGAGTPTPESGRHWPAVDSLDYDHSRSGFNHHAHLVLLPRVEHARRDDGVSPRNIGRRVEPRCVNGTAARLHNAPRYRRVEGAGYRSGELQRILESDIWREVREDPY